MPEPTCWICERPNPDGGDDPCRACEAEWDANPMAFLLDEEDDGA